MRLLSEKVENLNSTPSEFILMIVIIIIIIFIIQMIWFTDWEDEDYQENITKSQNLRNRNENYTQVSTIMSNIISHHYTRSQVNLISDVKDIQ